MRRGIYNGAMRSWPLAAIKQRAEPMPVAPRESDYSPFDFDDWSNCIRGDSVRT